MRSSCWKTIKSMKRLVFIVLSLIMILSVMGAGQNIQDIFENIRQHGTEYTFRARIVEKTGDKDNPGLVVQKIPTSDVREKRILVLITKDTKIGYQVHGTRPGWKDVAFSDLKEERRVVIKGLKVIEKKANQELIVVLATQIEFSE